MRKHFITAPRYMSFPTLALSKSGSVEVHNFLSARLRAPVLFIFLTHEGFSMFILAVFPGKYNTGQAGRSISFPITSNQYISYHEASSCSLWTSLWRRYEVLHRYQNHVCRKCRREVLPGLRRREGLLRIL